MAPDQEPGDSITQLPPNVWADAHSHLSDPRQPDVDGAIREAQALGIQVFLQGGVGPEDWERQKALHARVPGVLPVFGLHPYWVADHSEEDCESALDLLARELGAAYALGEIGLDFRPHIMKDSAPRQYSCFETQLELARVADKPVVLHIVRAFEEALRVLDLFGTGTRGLVHAFTGSAKQAEAYLERGFLLSVGGPVCRHDATKLHQAIQQIPLESLLIETDSPDQPPPGLEPEHNRPSTVLQVAGEVARIKKTTAAQVLDKSYQNLRKLLNPDPNL